MNREIKILKELLIKQFPNDHFSIQRYKDQIDISNTLNSRRKIREYIRSIGMKNRIRKINCDWFEDIK